MSIWRKRGIKARLIWWEYLPIKLEELASDDNSCLTIIMVTFVERNVNRERRYSEYPKM